MIHNAIDSKQFAFDIDKRQAIRNQYGISENTILLGHVGRFDNQKNHAFLISVFTELVKNNDNYKLMCIGDGWLREDIEKQIKENDLKDKVILAGWQENAGDFYNAFDLYVFPSLFEGLSFVLIEAQANGLACVCSDQVPQETNLSGTEKMRYLPLDKHVWVESLLKIGKPDRYDGEKYIIEQGYDIVHEARKLENIYIEMVRG